MFQWYWATCCRWPFLKRWVGPSWSMEVPCMLNLSLRSFQISLVQYRGHVFCDAALLEGWPLTDEVKVTIEIKKLKSKSIKKYSDQRLFSFRGLRYDPDVLLVQVNLEECGQEGVCAGPCSPRDAALRVNTSAMSLSQAPLVYFDPLARRDVMPKK